MRGLIERKIGPQAVTLVAGMCLGLTACAVQMVYGRHLLEGSALAAGAVLVAIVTGASKTTTA